MSVGESLSGVQAALIEVQIATCMTKLGWSYQAAPPPVDVAPVFGRFGEVLPDLPNGYMRVPLVETAETSTVPEAGEKYWLALNGVPGETTTIKTDDGVLTMQRMGGCVGEAQASVFGSQDEYLRFAAAYFAAENVLNDTNQILAADREVVEVLDRWVACMGDKGYAYDSMSGVRDVDWALVPRVEMMAAYQSDLDCQQSSGFRGVVERAADRAADKAVRNSERAIAELRELAQSILDL